MAHTGLNAEYRPVPAYNTGMFRCGLFSWLQNIDTVDSSSTVDPLASLSDTEILLVVYTDVGQKKTATLCAYYFSATTALLHVLRMCTMRNRALYDRISP